MKKIPRSHKKYLNPEAKVGDGMLMPGGLLYLCRESANHFLFARWERVTVWEHPFTYARVRFNLWRYFK